MSNTLHSRRVQLNLSSFNRILLCIYQDGKTLQRVCDNKYKNQTKDIIFSWQRNYTIQKYISGAVCVYLFISHENLHIFLGYG